MTKTTLLYLIFMCSYFTSTTTPSLKADTIILGGGCFWCLEAAYKLLPGVTHITSGYAGGTTSNPTYEQVCSETTGHAEVIKIDYDPQKTNLEKLLAFFWHVHNPTQMGGQGNDMGDQYRSIILYSSLIQKTAAEKSKLEIQNLYKEPITTQILPLSKFWAAEDYHQDYFTKHPNQGYCSVVIKPKIQKLKHLIDNSM